MGSLDITLLVILSIVLLLIMIIVIILFVNFKSLKKQESKVEHALLGISTALTNKYELLLKIDAELNGYLSSIKLMPNYVIESKRPLKYTSVNQNVVYEEQLDEDFRRVLLLVEQYPFVKTSNALSKINISLNTNAIHLNTAKRLYNSNAEHLNRMINTFLKSKLANRIALDKIELYPLKT